MSARLPSRGRRRALPTAAVLTLVLSAALIVGVVGGGTLALWRDTETVSARMPAGVVVFGAGAPAAPGSLADYATSATDTVEATFGAAAAATLYATGSVAVPFQVDALAQGHRGLTYTVSTHVDGGVFGDSTLRLVRVPTATACTVGATGAATSSSTPVSSAYSSGTTLTTEYWCLVATFDPVRGSYANTASVDATPVTSGGPTAVRLHQEAGWSAQLRAFFTPVSEPTHRLVFSFRTFRGTAP